MDMTGCMAAPCDDQQASFGTEAISNASMMAQVLISLGKLEAKIDMMMAEDKAEDDSETETETESEPIATNPMIPSTQLEFDLPPIF